MLNNIFDLDPMKMYVKAKKQKIKFYDFHEWIAYHLQKAMYSVEHDFFEEEKNHLLNKEGVQIIKMDDQTID